MLMVVLLMSACDSGNAARQRLRATEMDLANTYGRERCRQIVGADANPNSPVTYDCMALMVPAYLRAIDDAERAGLPMTTVILGDIDPFLNPIGQDHP
jgi:hypothetical protein